MTRYDEFPFPGLPSVHELTDASNECRHGRLPFDPGPRCSCWNVGWSPGVKPVVKKRAPRPQHPWILRQRAIRLRESGLSFEHVGELVGVAPNSVRRWVRQAGVRDDRRAA